MDFPTLIKPLTINEFVAKVKANESFLMLGKGKRNFSDLLSLAEIETALNSGCNINNPMQIILETGERGYFIDQNLHWSVTALRKKNLTQLLKAGHSFVMMNMSQINEPVARLIDTIENSIDYCHADLHLYISPIDDATGYMAHRDRPQHKIYLQVVGNTSWQLFSHSDDLPDEDISIPEKNESKYLTEIMNFTMVPGDVLYMPPGQVHKVRNHAGPRISFSIPFVIDPGNTAPRMDRSHIPLQEIWSPDGESNPDF